jgi:hypothetical protein
MSDGMEKKGKHMTLAWHYALLHSGQTRRALGGIDCDETTVKFTELLLMK